MAMQMQRAFNARMLSPMIHNSRGAGQYDSTNTWIPGEITSRQIYGVIQAGNKFSQFDVGQALHSEDGGSRWSSYRNLYVINRYQLAENDTIQYDGILYLVKQESDEEVFGFHSYILEEQEPTWEHVDGEEGCSDHLPSQVPLPETYLPSTVTYTGVVSQGGYSEGKTVFIPDGDATASNGTVIFDDMDFLDLTVLTSAFDIEAPAGVIFEHYGFVYTLVAVTDITESPLECNSFGLCQDAKTFILEGTVTGNDYVDAPFFGFYEYNLKCAKGNGVSCDPGSEITVYTCDITIPIPVT